MIYNRKGNIFLWSLPSNMLIYISQHPGTSIKFVARNVDTSPSNGSKVLKVIQAMNLINKVKNGRTAGLTLNEKGNKIAKMLNVIKEAGNKDGRDDI